MQAPLERHDCYENLGKRVLVAEFSQPQNVDATDMRTELKSNNHQHKNSEDASSSEGNSGNIPTTEGSKESVSVDSIALTPIPDQIGGGRFSNASKTSQKFSGHVKSCKKSFDGRWFYIFDNDQVWKQVGSHKYRHKNCDFDVTLSRDFFGYIMRIDDQKLKIRVNRKR